MPVFTAAATALFAGTALAGTFAVGATAFALQVGAGIALNYAASALSGANNNEPEAAKADNFSMQGKLQAGGTVPRSYNVGYSATAGSLVYANYWGQVGETPNAFLTQAIALSDMPGGTLREVWVNGEMAELGDVVDPNLGKPVLKYRKDGADHLWIKFYDGTQTTADWLLVNRAGSTERPYPATRVGYGVSYVVCTAQVPVGPDALFTGFPTFKFAVSGIPLYDISKDSSMGGVGPQRWSDRSTWGGDGDNLPAVQIYNLLRGITYNGTWLHGLQGMSAARLPAANWIAQINKCRETIAGVGGVPEPTYRSGGQIGVDSQTANAVEALLTACQGRISEIGGFYKIHLGAPDSPTFSWTDADLLSTEQQTYKPFCGLADSINGITGSYPYPAEGWNTKVAPPYYRSDLEARDGNRRLLANPAFDMVPYFEQVQRLMKSALDEAQRARTHVLAFPPQYWIVEPGDIGSWTSLRNGYVNKQFRVDAGTDKANLDVILHVTEVDPADYDWDHNTDFRGFVTGPTTFARPAPQGVMGWAAEPYTIKDADGYSRRPAIRLMFDGALPGIRGVTYQVRLASDGTPVTSNNTDQISLGAVIVAEGILPNTAYQVRGQYIPTAPRDMLWSDWITVTTSDVKLSLRDLDAAVVSQVASIAAYNDSPMRQVIETIAAFVANQDARNWTDQQRIRSQLAARSDAAHAEVEHVSEVMAAADAALASDILTVSTNLTNGLTATNAAVSANATAISNVAGSLGSYVTTVSAAANYATLTGLATTNANVTTASNAITLLNGYAAAQQTVTLDVNGYVVGTNFINGGPGVSGFTVTVDKFQVAFPGVAGGAAVPVWTVANVNGVPKVAIRGDMIIDGSITTQHISTGTFSALWANITYLVGGYIRSPDSKMVVDLNNGRIEVWS